MSVVVGMFCITDFYSLNESRLALSSLVKGLHPTNDAIFHENKKFCDLDIQIV